MDGIKDLWNSMRLSIIERVGNPLTGAYCLAWCVWNFRILLVTFSSGDWKPKIDYIDGQLMTTWKDWLIHGYLVPLAFALVWIFILPQLLRRVLVFHREQIAKTAKAVMIADGAQPIDAEEANQLRLRLIKLDEEWQQERAAYLKQIDDLSQRIALHIATEATLQSKPFDSAVESNPIDVDHPTGTGIQDSHVLSFSELQTDAEGKSLWPNKLGKKDLEQLPSSVASKVSGHPFQNEEIQALLAMRNWKRVEANQLALALKIEKFDAQVIIDRLRGLDLLSRGVEGTVLNADGRMLTSFFKRLVKPVSGTTLSESDG
jgi:hypothetical protein